MHSCGYSKLETVNVSTGWDTDSAFYQYLKCVHRYVLCKWTNCFPFNNWDFGDYRSVCTLLFADQVVISSNRDVLQRALHELHKIIKNNNLFLSVKKSEVIAYCEAFPKRTKVVIANGTIEQTSSFNFLRRNISYLGNVDVWSKDRTF